MKEKKAKKLGEVLAFARVGKETFQRAKDGLVTVWDESKVNGIIDELNSHIEEIESVINSLEENEIGLKKAGATEEKLSSMRDMYIGDEWDDPIEVFEWLGFFQGAAIIHWVLIAGFAESESDDELASLADKMEEYHRNLFEIVSDSIKKTV